MPLYTSRDMISMGLSLYGAWHYNRADASRLLGVIADSGELLDRQITHRLPMSAAQEAFELQISGETGKGDPPPLGGVAPSPEVPLRLTQQLRDLHPRGAAGALDGAEHHRQALMLSP